MTHPDARLPADELSHVRMRLSQLRPRLTQAERLYQAVRTLDDESAQADAVGVVHALRNEIAGLDDQEKRLARRRARARRNTLILVMTLLLLVAGGGTAGTFVLMREHDVAKCWRTFELTGAQPKDAVCQAPPPFILDPDEVPGLAWRAMDRGVQAIKPETAVSPAPKQAPHA